MEHEMEMQKIRANLSTQYSEYYEQECQGEIFCLVIEKGTRCIEDFAAGKTKN